MDKMLQIAKTNLRSAEMLLERGEMVAALLAIHDAVCQLLIYANREQNRKDAGPLGHGYTYEGGEE